MKLIVSLTTTVLLMDNLIRNSEKVLHMYSLEDVVENHCFCFPAEYAQASEI
jgi:hypothetical protein